MARITAKDLHVKKILGKKALKKIRAGAGGTDLADARGLFGGAASQCRSKHKRGKLTGGGA